MAVVIDSERCETCGICGDVCPRHIPETINRGDDKVTIISRERANLCTECGHCAAVCPNEAIRLDGFDMKEFAPVTDAGVYEDQILTLMRQRRSIRRYKDKPVPRDILNRIVDAACQAPTGTGRRTTGVIIIDKEETLSTLSEMAYDLYESLDRNLGNPVARFIIRRRVGRRVLATLQDFVMPGMRWYIRWYREGKSNEILRDCSALFLFHSPVREAMAAENCLVAAFHAIFMAEVLGIGTCLNDLIPPACNRAPDIRKLLELPDDREVYSSITLGYSKYRFKRTIPRRLAEVRYLK